MRSNRGRRRRMWRMAGWLSGFSLVLISPFTGSAFGQEPPPLEPAYRAFYSGDMAGSRAEVEAYLSRFPYDGEANILMARILAGSGDPSAAFERLAGVLERNPEDVDALFFLAALASALSQQEYAQLYSQAPDSARVHQLLGQSYRARNQLPEAESEFRAALRQAPELYEVQLALGEVLEQSGKLEEAAEVYEQAVKVAPGKAEGYVRLGQVRQQLGQPERAKAALDRAQALRRPPTSNP